MQIYKDEVQLAVHRNSNEYPSFTIYNEMSPGATEQVSGLSETGECSEWLRDGRSWHA